MNLAMYFLFILWAVSLLLNANLHGKIKTGNYNFWTSLIALSIEITLLYYAGLFNNLK
jgi:hypothetical protein